MKDETLFIRQPLETRDGVPLYAKDQYWGKASAGEMAEALRTIDEKGWEEFSRRYEGKFDFTFDDSRADWRFNIPVTRDSVILDTGAGMGRSAIPLARVAKTVVAFDQSFLRMAFVRRRAEKEGLSNLHICVADIYDLPFPEKSFDVIAMNGVLEWVGKSTICADPRQAQIKALEICRRLLKPGGYLYIGIENRLAATYLKAPDHGGLKWTGFMPRRLANWYALRRQGQEYRTYTYSKAGYEKLLREAGFAKQAYYLPYPGYNLPRITVPYDNLRALGYVISTLMQGNSLSRRLFKAATRIPGLLRMYRLVFFSFNIVAQS